MMDVKFANPEFLFLALLIPVMVYWRWKGKRRTTVELQVSTTQAFREVPRTWRQRFRKVLVALRFLTLALLTIALARPQSSSRGENVSTEGIDIVMATDISGSMLAEDFHPNRVEAAKMVAADFIEARQNDRIGLVIFSGESFTQCPLTLDHAVVKNLLSQVKTGMIEDGTAIGSGLATAVTRLKDSKAKSRVIILLTDGKNNRGAIDPLTAASIAQTFGVRVYTIGVGTMGVAPYPVQTQFGVQYQNMPVEIDEELLKKIANETGGKYFRATDNQKLKAIYGEIDHLEKTKIEVTQFRKHTEEFYSAAMFAGFFLMLEVLLSYTMFRKIP